MSTCEREPALLAHFVRKLRGGSQPVLAATNDGKLYVVKFTNNLQGPSLPFNESMGTELYHLCGLPAPSWQPMLVTASFLDQNPGCWIETAEGKLRPKEGVCFGSGFLCEENSRVFEILPGKSFERICNREAFWLAWLLDICASHTDNRQAIFRQDRGGMLDAFFIDHGHMFGGPRGDYRVHFRAPQYLDARIYPDVSSKLVASLRKSVRSVDADLLWVCARALPAEWKTTSALDKFIETLETLSKPRMIEGAIETMLDSHRRMSGKINDLRCDGSPEGSVLRLGIPAAGLRKSFVH